MSASNQGPYSQHIIFIVTYEATQEARMLHNISLQRLSNVNAPAYWSNLYVIKKRSVMDTVQDGALLMSQITNFYWQIIG